MLVLSARRGESIVCRGDVVVHVVAVRGGRVRLGFTGPGRVYRERLWQAIQKDGPRKAALSLAR